MFLECPKCGCEDVEFEPDDEKAECPDCHYVGKIEADADCEGDPPEFRPYYTMLDEGG